MLTKDPEISVIVPISERHDDVRKIYQLYSDELKRLGHTFEFIFIVDGVFPLAYEALKDIKREKQPIRIIKFSKTFGESAALTEGFRQAKGDSILTLASYQQMKPEDLKKIFDAFDEKTDLVITRRFPRIDPIINRIQSDAYHYILKKFTGTSYRDITSGARLIKKSILPEIILYGDLHRFIPVLAERKGYRVKEVDVAHSVEDTQLRLVSPGTYLRRILDILTLFFLIKFTQKPLRFFGLIGSSLFFVGGLISLYLFILRIFLNTPLSNRPLLILGILLIVFGVQTLSLGLVGELIIYSHAETIKNYNVEEIIE